MHNATLVPITEERLDALVLLVKELVVLSSYKTPFDATWTKGIARGGMNDDNFFGRMAQLSDGRYCGFVVGSVAKFLFSPRSIGIGETLYVRETTPYRASIAGTMLAEMEAWMISKNVDFIRAGETSEICPKAVDAFYRRHGYRQAGTLYKKDCV